MNISCFLCPKVSKIWKKVQSRFIALTGKQIEIDVKIALFGIPKNDIDVCYFKSVNHILLIARMSISIAKKTNNISALNIIFENALKDRNIF